MTQLRAERVVLRPVVAADFDVLRRIRSEPEVAAWWEPPPPGWPERDDPALTRLAVVMGADVVGLVQYAEEADPDARHADIDIFLTTGVHGRGLGTEALARVVEHLHDDRGHHRLTLFTDPGNARAIRSYEKVGFRRVGVLEASARWPTGEWRDELMMERVVLPGRGAQRSAVAR